MPDGSADAKLPEEIEKQLRRFRVAMEKLEKMIESSFNTPFSQIDKELTPLQAANYYLNIAQTVYHAHLLLLRTQGSSTGKACPITAENDRLKAYAKKVRKLGTAEYLATHRPSTEINIAAANRFINHAIPDLTAEQKAALKQMGRKRKEQPEEPLALTGSTADMARAFLQHTLGPTAKRGK